MFCIFSLLLPVCHIVKRLISSYGSVSTFKFTFTFYLDSDIYLLNVTSFLFIYSLQFNVKKKVQNLKD